MFEIIFLILAVLVIAPILIVAFICFLLIFQPGYLILGIIIIILLFYISKKLPKTCDKIINNIQHTIEKNEKEKRTLSKQWINNLKSGRQVNIGEATIQCKNQMLIINKKSFYIKEIQELELTYKVLSVSKTTIDTYRSLISSNIGYNPQVIMEDYRMTVEEYNRDIALKNAITKEIMNGNNNLYYKAGVDRYMYQYKFDKEYYISITFYNGHNELCPVALCTGCDKETLNAPNEESLVLELKNYIKTLKESE